MQVATRAVIEVPATTHGAFDLLVDYANCSRFFQRWGPIPGVVRCEAMADDDDGRARRRLVLTDGSVYVEKILVSERPHTYRYRWLNPPPLPIKLVVRSAEAHWVLQPFELGQHTRIEWTYYFELTNPLMYPFALALRAMFNRWMVLALDRIRQASVDAG